MVRRALRASRRSPFGGRAVRAEPGVLRPAAEVVEDVTQLLAFRPQVAEVLLGGFGLQGNPLLDRQAVAFEAGALRRVVREQPHRPYAEVEQDLRADPVVARVRREPELDVRLDGVPSGLLQL